MTAKPFHRGTGLQSDETQSLPPLPPINGSIDEPIASLMFSRRRLAAAITIAVVGAVALITFPPGFWRPLCLLVYAVLSVLGYRLARKEDKIREGLFGCLSAYVLRRPRIDGFLAGTG